MRKLRRLRPGSVWHVTVRCSRAEFRLKPDVQRRDLCAFWLARAQKQAPGVQIVTVMQMSNHLHLILKDNHSRLSAFMRHFLGNLSKAIGEIDHVRGQLFERRYTATEIVDLEAAYDVIAYIVTNPVAAKLVAHYSEWPGLCLFGNIQLDVQRFRRRAYTRAKLTGQNPNREQFIDRACLLVELPEGFDLDSIQARIDARLGRLTQERGKQKVLGGRKVLRQDPFDRPQRPKRSKLPLCHASTKEIWQSYLHGWKKFVELYREASRAYREGMLNAPFPAHSFRPSILSG